MQTPYAALYLYYLWASTHYQFYPLLMLAVGYFVFNRISYSLPTGRNRSKSRLLLTSSLILALVATSLVSAWLGYLGFVFAFAALLSEFSDRETGKPLTYLSWPLIIAWQPPYNDLATADTYLITYLQRLSAQFSSQLLDALGVIHVQSGSALELLDQSFNVEQGCSGVQSFFAIICISAIMMIAFRRPILHSSIVVLSSVFWTIVMNTVRITMIPIGTKFLSIDLANGTPHQIIGFLAMGIATWLLLSTDQVVFILLGRSIHPGKEVSRETRLARDSADTMKMPSRVDAIGWTWPWRLLILIVAINAAVQLLDLQRKTLRLLDGNIFLDFDEGDLPKSIAGWQKIGYRRETRKNDADFGERSDVWEFRKADTVGYCSLDQTFRLWHDLLVCYRNGGWEKIEDKVVFAEDSSWPIVMASFKRLDGRTATLAYCMFDRSGLPLEVPGYLDLFAAMKNRLEKRFSQKAGELMREQSCYQAQVFILTKPGVPLLQESVLDLLSEAREAFREKGLSRLQN